MHHDLSGSWTEPKCLLCIQTDWSAAQIICMSIQCLVKAFCSVLSWLVDNTISVFSSFSFIVFMCWTIPLLFENLLSHCSILFCPVRRRKKKINPALKIFCHQSLAFVLCNHLHFHLTKSESVDSFSFLLQIFGAKLLLQFCQPEMWKEGEKKKKTSPASFQMWSFGQFHSSYLLKHSFGPRKTKQNKKKTHLFAAVSYFVCGRTTATVNSPGW